MAFRCRSIEGFFDTLKSEEAFRPYLTGEDSRAAIARYIHGFYNSERMHFSLGYKSPNEFAKQLKARCLNPL